MKEYSLIFFSIVMGCLFFSSCANEELDKKERSKATTITLSFKAPDAERVVTKGVGGYTTIKDIYLFIFDSNGNLEGEPLIYNIESADKQGSIASGITTTTGDHYIYAIANPAGSTFATVDELTGVADKQDLLLKVAEWQSGSDLLVSGNLVPMTGVLEGADEEGMIKITDKGTYIVELKRIVASVKFEVSCGNAGATFDLKSSEVVNAPLKTTLWGDNKSIQNKNNWPVATINTTASSQTFEFYMFENKQKPIGDIYSYDDREAKENPAQVTDIKFKNASSHATYVILRGLYTGPASIDGKNENVSAEVAYYVHLGDINKGYDDFETCRNIEYTYKVSIKGINELVTEVTSSDPYDRGDGKISLVASTFNLDSHYEVFNITVPKGNEYTKDDGVEELGWVSFRIFDTTDRTHLTQALVPGKEGQWKDVMRYKDYGNQDYNNSLITNMSQLNSALSSYFEKNPTAKEVVLTCFVDENVDLNTYRECLVFRDKRTGNGSTILRDGFRFRQNYLRKFFDNGGSYYGLEVLNESGALGFDDYGTNKKTEDMFDGLANMKTEVGTTWPSVNDMKSFYAACMSRNRDENGNGQIDNGEMKWYLPAINQYIGMWIGADALQEARLYRLDHGSSDWRYVSNSFDANNNRKDHWIMWGDEGSSVGLMNRGGASKYQLRCIRNIGDPVNNFYYTYEGNVFTMNLVGEGVYRSKQSTGELGIQDGHMGTDNKVYRKFRVAKETTGSSLTLQDQRDKANKDASICSKYHEDFKDGCGEYYIAPTGSSLGYFKNVGGGKGNYKLVTSRWRSYMKKSQGGGYDSINESQAFEDDGKWRLPNQREISLMFAENLLTGGDNLSRTFSTFEPKRGFGYDGNLRLYGADEINKGLFTVRCVRDVD